MKKRIGSLYGRPIIEGDINLKNNSEIHISELNEGSGSGSGSELKWEYYKINHPEENWDIIMNAVIWATYLYYTSDDSTCIEYIGRAYPYISDDYRNVHKIACSSIPMGYISSDGYSGNANEGSWKSNFIKFSDGDYDEELFDAVLTPITKEEFYTFDNNNAPE